MAELRAEGIDLMVHDTAVTKDTPLAGLQSYVQHGSKGLGQLAGSLKDMLCDDATEVVSGTDAVIVVPQQRHLSQSHHRRSGDPRDRCGEVVPRALPDRSDAWHRLVEPAN